MKRLFFEFICDWRYQGRDYVGTSLIELTFDYLRNEPSMAVRLVILGFGFSVVWLCPWETEGSIEMKKIIEEVENWKPIPMEKFFSQCQCEKETN